MYLLLLAQITFYFLGYLRPSIIYDYIDYWPITILPILLVTIFRRASFYELLRNIVNIFLIVVVLIFSFGHLFDSKFLTTYKYDSFFQNNELSSDFNYSLLIDLDGKDNFEIHYDNGREDRPWSGWKKEIERLNSVKYAMEAIEMFMDKHK